MKITLIVLAAIVVLFGAYVIFIGPIPGITTSHTNTNTDASNSKLDMNVVCQSALAYMTFQDDAHAQAFIAECKEGKHPEVIEHYKAQMNLGSGAAI
jgi:hypothetical protein